MAVVALCSAAGSPGVTTLAIGLSLTWHRSVILVDADPGAYQAVLAGYLRGRVRTGKGLQRVAEAHRDRRRLAEVVHDQTVPMTDQGSQDRLLLPGFARPANAALFAPVWPDLMETLLAYESAGIDVVIDLGRMDAVGPPQALLQSTDLVALVTHGSLRSVAAARSYASLLADQTDWSGGDQNAGLIVVGENKPYGRREIARALQLTAITVIADDPGSAASLSEGSHRSRKFDRGPFAKSLHHAAGELRRWIRHRRERLGLSDPEQSAVDGHRTGVERPPVNGSDGAPDAAWVGADD